jgi:glycosyltransferase involved in cell wall biosynthesis
MAPRNFFSMGPYGRQLQRLGIEILVAPHFNKVQDILLRRSEWDAILAFRFQSIASDIDAFRATYPNALVIFHDIDIHYLRTLRRAQLLEDHIMRKEGELFKEQELEVFAKVDCSVVVTEAEKKTIEAEIPVSNIIVYPYTIAVTKSAVSFGERKHICFVGGFAHDPNVDAVEYFLRNIWPRARPGLPAGTKFLVIGPAAPDKLLKLASDNVEFLGFVPELSPIFDQCRLAVAPLRYGAGIKGKLVASLAHGLPAVATNLALEGMGLVDGEHILTGDSPDEFARSVIQLFENAKLWKRIQENGYAFVEKHYSWKVGVESIKRILRVASDAWIVRHASARKEKLNRIVEEQASLSTSRRVISGRPQGKAG